MKKRIISAVLAATLSISFFSMGNAFASLNLIPANETLNSASIPTNSGTWVNGIYYPYGYNSNPKYTYDPYGYWYNGAYTPYTTTGYWKDGVYYPNGGSIVTGTNYPYGYVPYNNSYTNGYYPYGYYSSNAINGNYPYGYYPYNYYNPSQYTSALGGITVPDYLLSQAVINGRNVGFVLRGQSSAYAKKEVAPVAGKNASTLDFYETVGRAYDQSLSVSFVAQGSGVALDEQASVAMSALIKDYEKVKELGLESVTFADQGKNVFATIRINDELIKNLKAAYKNVGADETKDRFVIQFYPISESELSSEIQSALGKIKANSNVYVIKAYVVSDGTKRIDISDSLGKVNLRVKALSTERSLLAYYNGSKFESVKGTFVLEQGSALASAYGDVQLGSTVVIARVKG